jgi:hypothetical protein
MLKARSYYWDAMCKTWYRTLTGTEAITSEVAWLKESIYNGRSVKLKFDVRDALLCYSKGPCKKVIKEI